MFLLSFTELAFALNCFAIDVCASFLVFSYRNCAHLRSWFIQIVFIAIWLLIFDCIWIHDSNTSIFIFLLVHLSLLKFAHIVHAKILIIFLSIALPIEQWKNSNCKRFDWLWSDLIWANEWKREKDENKKQIKNKELHKN